MAEVKLTWKDDLQFEVEQDNHTYLLDGAKDNKGVTPKALLLSALAGCSGMDVVSLLKKMRVEGYKLDIVVHADVADEHPKVYTGIELTLKLEGDSIPENKVRKAVELSITRYCPVYIMLDKAVIINTRIYINGKEIEL